jgi:hypothetical protein
VSELVISIPALQADGIADLEVQDVLAPLLEVAIRFRHTATMWHRRFHPGPFTDCANLACASDRALLDRFAFDGPVSDGAQ